MPLIRLMLISGTLLFLYAVVLTALMFTYGWLALAVIATVLLARRPKSWTDHGSARFASVAEVQHLLYGTGIFVGRMGGTLTRKEGLRALFSRLLPAREAVHRFLHSIRQPIWKRNGENLVRLTNAVHTSVFAPSGAGKGVSIILPFLLTCPESCVVIDPKGENFTATSQARRRRFGHRVIRLDPYGICGRGGDRFNPLDFMGTDEKLLADECRSLAEALIVRTGQDHGIAMIWSDSAAELSERQVTPALLGYALHRNGQMALPAWRMSVEGSAVSFSAAHCVPVAGLNASLFKYAVEATAKEASAFDAKLRAAGLL